MAAFEDCKNHPAQDKYEDKVHGKPEKPGNGENFEWENVFIVDKKFQENRIIGRVDPKPAVYPGFHIPENDQEKPTEGKTHMHKSQQWIPAKHLPVKQAFEEDLFERYD
jgi:hypothetical protein